MEQLNIEKIENIIVEELRQDFDAIAMPRSAYVLENLVVKVHEHPSQQWLQCVLEMRSKYNNIRRHLVNRQKLQREIETLEDELDQELKRIDLDDLEWSLLGAEREFFALYAIYQTMPRFTREEIEAGQREYWLKRLLKQSTQDILATGRIGQGNIEGLRQINLGVQINDRGQMEIVGPSVAAMKAI